MKHRIFASEIEQFITRVFKDKPDRLVSGDDESVINIVKPQRYGDVVCDHDASDVHFEPCDWQQYFTDIADGYLRLVEVCGMRLEDNYTQDALQCDYCRNWCCKKQSQYYYCPQCRQDMCSLCFSETSEEIAVANGAKNWHKRSDALAACRQHGMQLRDFDAVVVVQENENGKQRCLMDMTSFGSFLDWVPVLQAHKSYDDPNNLLLVNANPDSPLYLRLAMSAGDDHGRMGFDILSAQWTSVEQICTRVEEIAKEYKETIKELDGWQKYYNTPPKLLMMKENIRLHYGG